MNKIPASVRRDRIAALHAEAVQTRRDADDLAAERNEAIYYAITSGVRRALIAADLNVTEPRVDAMMDSHRKRLKREAEAGA